MRIAAVSEPASSARANEDWHVAAPGLIVVVDGATARTGTGCVHGVSWFAAQLGAAVAAGTAGVGSIRCSLRELLAAGISHVAGLHPGCDLDHAGTPSAAVGIVRVGPTAVEHLVLGDVTVVIEHDDDAGIEPHRRAGNDAGTVHGEGPTHARQVSHGRQEHGRRLVVVTDDRVERTAEPQRREADQHPIGSPEKQAALVRMKHAELAHRNVGGGFWVAAADPDAARHALTGEVPLDRVRRLAVLTDGAARLVQPFAAVSWRGLLDVAADAGPAEVVRRVRALEADDADGRRWPRNKRSDDATLVYAERHAPVGPAGRRW